MDVGSDVVVCMATYGPRLEYAPLAIESIARGTIKPGRFILVVDEGDEISPALEDFRSQGLEIWSADAKLGPHKKWYPFARQYPNFNNIFVTADDDVIYPPSWLEDLLLYASSKLVVAHRGHSILTNQRGLAPYAQWIEAPRNTGNKFFVTGVGGIAYPASVLQEAAAHGEEFLYSCPKADDVWLNRAIIRCTVPIVLLGASSKHHLIQGSQEVSLWSDNEAQNDMQLAATFTADDISSISSGQLKDILIREFDEAPYQAEISSLRAAIEMRNEQIMELLQKAEEYHGYAGELENIVHDRDATISNVAKEMESVRNSAAYRLSSYMTYPLKVIRKLSSGK